MARTNGKVKWFSQDKGYGFIEQENGPDVFVHHTGIEGTGFKTLYEGEDVEFEVVDEPKGPKARGVVRLNPPAEPPRRAPGGPRREGRPGAGRGADRGYGGGAERSYGGGY